MCNAMYKIVKERLQDEIEEVRSNAEKTGKEIGRADGIKSGENRVNTLIYKLISLDRMDDVIKCVSNKEYQNRLFREFQL